MSDFEIKTGIDIPPRTSFPRGARGSQYPLAEIEEGACFDVPVADAKEAAQKRSYLSQLGKSRDIQAVTRFYPEGAPDENGNVSDPRPTVRCWNGGERDHERDRRNEEAAAKRAEAKRAKAAMAMDVGEA